MLGCHELGDTDMPRPNWFFAFPVDGAFVLGLPSPPKSFRRFHPEDVHLTLAFLGACGEERSMKALDALDALAAKAPNREPRRIPYSLAEVTPMGSRRHYSALSAMLADGREETEAYIASLRDVLTETATGRREERKPKAHVTIARPRRRATDPQREEGLEWAQNLDLRAVRGVLDRIALYTWDETRRERLFRIVAERRIVV
jgi:RNA 2',3'-cyclic 3'-phosphodiesterase